VEATSTDWFKKQTRFKRDYGRSFYRIPVGFAALLTPCVFPMIPMTVAFLLNKVKEVKVLEMLLFMEFDY
jgi:thiol:disulfide interchange protein